MTDIRWIADNEVTEKWPFWTRANVGEVLPEPVSPLGWELVWADGVLKGWYDSAVNRLGFGDIGLDPDRAEMAGLIGGYAYLNATSFRIFGARAPGMTAEDMDMAYFGDHPDVPPYVAQDWHVTESGVAVLEGWLGWVMGSMDQSELEAERIEGHEARASRPDLGAASDRELLDRARSYEPMIRRMFDQHVNQGGAASVGPGAIGAVCVAIGRPEAAMRLFSGLGGVDSAAPSYEMWELSRTVRGSDILNELFDLGASGLNQRLGDSTHPDAVAAMAALDEFLVEFGSRGPNEWDLYSHTWETNPDLVWAAVDRMRLADDSASPLAENKSREAERESLTEELVAALAEDPETQGMFQAALASAKTFMPGRERSKTTIIRVIQEVRMAMWELGNRMVAKGLIDEPRDICMLFPDEVEAYVEGGDIDVAATVTGRQGYYSWLQTLEPPHIINGSVPPNTEWPTKDTSALEAATSGDTLVGNPGCTGVHRGVARIVLDPSDPTALEPGDVLVAPMTDPAWTPLFVAAGAVVVDVGAALSHAIIVSRELGIPCVVSATDATRKIPDGAMIEVNGDTGVVTIL